MRPFFSKTAVLTTFLTKFTTSLDIDIPFSLLYPGGETGLTHFFDSSTADQILNHGCWCSRINALNAPEFYTGPQLGGANSQDDIDLLCKKWIDNRKCCSLNGGSCFNEITEAAYNIAYTSSVHDATCSHNTNVCYIEACYIDTYYMKLIKNIIDAGEADFTSTATCSGHGAGYDENYCTGSVDLDTGIPSFRIVHTMAEAGLEPTPCDSSPCQNEGVCENNDANTDYTCTCAGNFQGRTCTACSGHYLGDDCDIVSACQSVEPCQNGGTCTDLDTFTTSTGARRRRDTIKISDFECSCLKNYAGATCEECNTMFDAADYPTCAACLNAELKRDVVFILDGSASVLAENFVKQIDFLKNYGVRIAPSSTGTRLAMVQYTVGDGYAVTECEFKDSQADWEACLDGVVFADGFTLTGKAMEHGYIDVVRQHARTDAQVSMIVVTDGRSFDNVKTFADQIRATNVQIFAVGIKNYNMAQLEEIANEPYDDFLITVDEFADLDGLEAVVMDSFIVDMCTQEFEFYDHQFVPAFAKCASGPCQNGATCADNIDFSDYYCTCTEDYTGTNCDIPIPCQFSPCATDQFTACENSEDYLDFTCTCTNQFQGKTCNEVFTQCHHPALSDPCQNGGTCIDLETFTSQTWNYDGVDYTENVSDYVCNCVETAGQGFYTGELCDSAYDPCAVLSPCMFSAECTTATDLSDYDCACDSSYYGKNCHIGHNAICSDDPPCWNDGLCVDGPNNITYTCDCNSYPEEKPWYTGTDCESLHGCSFTPCENGGACTDVLTDGLTGEIEGYTCDCSAVPWQSAHCEIVDYCFGDACNGGNCTDTGESYTCECPEYYYGDSCEIYYKCPGSQALDIIFVVDGSGSVGADNWLVQVQFLKDVVAAVNLGTGYVGPDYIDNRAAMVQYTIGDGDTITEFYFQNNATEFGILIDQVTYSGGVTLTGEAIKHARNDVLPQARTSSASFGGAVQTVMVVLTDGASLDTVGDASALVVGDGVKLVAVGVANYDLTQLQQMSADAITSEDFTGLAGILVDVANQVCPM